MRPVQDIIKNVQASSAAAGSGEFHVYKHSRRREFERIKQMERTTRDVSSVVPEGSLSSCSSLKNKRRSKLDKRLETQRQTRRRPKTAQRGKRGEGGRKEKRNQARRQAVEDSRGNWKAILPLPSKDPERVMRNLKGKRRRMCQHLQFWRRWSSNQ